MKMRSLLFVPGDRPDRMEKACASGADILILDLEDSVSPSAKAQARLHVRAFLQKPRSVPLFVRVNPPGSGEMEADLAAILSPEPDGVVTFQEPDGVVAFQEPDGVVAFQEPDGVVLPKAEGAASLAMLDRALGNSAAKILPIATETPAALFATGTYGGVTPRLCGLTWGAEDLSAALGAATAREPDGRYTPPYEMARSLALFGAHAAGVAAIETVYPDFRDTEGLARYARRGRRDGFTGMMAIHLARIDVINAAFSPSPAEIAEARRIVALFAQNRARAHLPLMAGCWTPRISPEPCSLLPRWIRGEGWV